MNTKGVNFQPSKRGQFSAAVDTTPEDSVGPLATISATAVDQVKPATHLGGPRLASLLLQP